MLNKYEITSNLTVGDQKAIIPSKLPLLKQLTDVKHSYFLGELETYKNREYPDIVAEDLVKLKPFFGYVSLGIDGVDGVELEHRENAMLMVFKVINNNLYLGVIWETDVLNKKEIKVNLVFQCDIETKTLIPIKNIRTTDSREMSNINDVLDEVGKILNAKWVKAVQEALHNEFIVREYEPTTFAFKKKVSAQERPLYRTYKLLKPLVLAGSQETKRGFVRDTVINNLIQPPKQFGSLIDQLKESVWFSGMGLITRGESYPVPDLSFLPYDNFTILTEYYHDVDLSNPVMLNVLRSNSGVEVYVYLRVGNDKRKSSLALCYHFRLSGNYTIIPQTVYPLENRYTGMPEIEYRKNLRQFEPFVQEVVKVSIAKFLGIVFNYDGDRVAGSFRRDKAIPKNAEPEYIPRNVHIVLDMSKRRESPMTFGGRQTGYHVKEHSRIAHVRKYKSGKVAHIGAMVINEGKGDQYGKVTKEYKL